MDFLVPFGILIVGAIGLLLLRDLLDRLAMRFKMNAVAVKVGFLVLAVLLIAIGVNIKNVVVERRQFPMALAQMERAASLANYASTLESQGDYVGAEKRYRQAQSMVFNVTSRSTYSLQSDVSWTYESYAIAVSEMQPGGQAGLYAQHLEEARSVHERTSEGMRGSLSIEPSEDSAVGDWRWHGGVLNLGPKGHAVYDDELCSWVVSGSKSVVVAEPNGRVLWELVLVDSSHALVVDATTGLYDGVAGKAIDGWPRY